MSKIAFIYPGQGAQKAGMGQDFYENHELAKAVFDEASKELGIDMKALCFEENEQLDLTEYTQAAMVTTCLAITEVLKIAGLTPDMTAGLSLGEYAAIAAAGGMSNMDAISLVRQRGILMQNTVPQGEGAMAAVLGMAAEDIEEVLEKFPGATIANYNCPGQIVITGKTEAVDAASVALKEAGAKRVIALNVSGPFHSQMLAPASEKLASLLEEVTWNSLKVPYVTNVDASVVNDIADAKDLLAKQICSPVRWMQSIDTMREQGIDTFVEIGPGTTLSGFLKKIDRSIVSYHVSSLEDLEKVVNELC